jgi:CRISPR/Cas system-associated protein Cas5 (RAMP superfamily)
VHISTLEDICKQIQEIDSSIRFAGIANKLGDLKTKSYRKNLVPLLTEKETSDYAMKAVLRAATREDYESKIGKLQYSIGKYEKMIRATIPIMIDKKDDENKLYLLLSFDLDSNVTHTIQNRVLPFILKNENVFV